MRTIHFLRILVMVHTTDSRSSRAQVIILFFSLLNFITTGDYYIPPPPLPTRGHPDSLGEWNCVHCQRKWKNAGHAEQPISTSIYTDAFAKPPSEYDCQLDDRILRHGESYTKVREFVID